MPCAVNTSICHECINFIQNSSDKLPSHIAKWLSNQRGKEKVNEALFKIAVYNDLPMLFENWITTNQLKLYMEFKQYTREYNKFPSVSTELYKKIISAKTKPIYKWIMVSHYKPVSKLDTYIGYINECVECIKNNDVITDDVVKNINNVKTAIKRNPSKYNYIIAYTNDVVKKYNIFNPLTTKCIKHKRTSYISPTRIDTVNKLHQYANHITEFGSEPTNYTLTKFKRYFIKTYANKQVHQYSKILTELGLNEYFKGLEQKTEPDPTPEPEKKVETQAPEFDLNTLKEYAVFVRLMGRNPFASKPCEKHLFKWYRTFKSNIYNAIANNINIQYVIESINDNNMSAWFPCIQNIN